LNKVLRGYVELIKAAETIDELKEVGKDINLYLDTVSSDRKDSRRRALVVEYKLNLAEIKQVGTRNQIVETETVEMDIEPGTVDFSRVSDGLVTIMVSDFIARQRNLPNIMTGHVMHHTNKAVLFRSEMDDLDYEGWLPLSQIRFTQGDNQRGSRLRRSSNRETTISPILDQAIGGFVTENTVIRERIAEEMIRMSTYPLMSDSFRYGLQTIDESINNWRTNTGITINASANAMTDALKRVRRVGRDLSESMSRAMATFGRTTLAGSAAFSGIRMSYDHARVIAEATRGRNQSGYRAAIFSISAMTTYSSLEVLDMITEAARGYEFDASQLAVAIEARMNNGDSFRTAMTKAKEHLRRQRLLHRGMSDTDFRRIYLADWVTPPDRQTNNFTSPDMTPEEYLRSVRDSWDRVPYLGQMTEFSIIDDSAVMTVFENHDVVQQVLTVNTLGTSISEDDVIRHIASLLDSGSWGYELARRLQASNKLFVYRPMKCGMYNDANGTRSDIRWATPQSDCPSWLTHERVIAGDRGFGDRPQVWMVDPVFNAEVLL
jgi:hypothetical protein